jgi:16S rRNA G527 N7-methylase RsmG
MNSKHTLAEAEAKCRKSKHFVSILLKFNNIKMNLVSLSCSQDMPKMHYFTMKITVQNAENAMF